jgi:hypothetical protein
MISILANIRVAIVISAVSLPGIPALAGGPAEFARDVSPILKDHCLGCHGPEKQKGGLRLDRRESALDGGESGEPGIVPGKAAESRLIQLVTSGDEKRRMPPKGKPLGAAEIDVLRRWIDAGAVWPESAGAAAPARMELAVTDNDRDHWAFRPLKPVATPSVRDQGWVRTPVDTFILSAQEAKGVVPTPEADARTLIRRVYFDLIGLPPVLTETDGRLKEERLGVSIDPASFERTPSDYEALVDKLLASPQHGERWGRHWLDVARYADSNGPESDIDRPNAYHYRDFVIRAFNDDMPYDRFVRLQLAGDEIDPGDPDAIAATGFIVSGNSVPLNVPMEEEKLRNRANELDDMVSTTGQAFLSLTLACARCHDHKYDPIPSRDYYRLMRIFNSGDRKDVPMASPSERKRHDEELAAWKSRLESAARERNEWLKTAQAPFVDALRAEKIARLPLNDDDKGRLRDHPDDPAVKALADRFKNELRINDTEFLSLYSFAQLTRLDELDQLLDGASKSKPPDIPLTFAFADFGPEPRETWFFERGNFLARNERMDLGFLTVLTTDKTADDYWKTARETKLRDDSTQQRRALAEWITDLDHGAGALLARVIVNRVWQHHFGEGLVRTVGDFGTRGEPPTHPELLEWLAEDFVRNGWSIKHLHRLIVTSATYRQGPPRNESNLAIDPDNRLLWCRRPQRLEAEALRDAMLASADSLNVTMFGPSFRAPIVEEAMQARNLRDPYPSGIKDSYETRKRSVYMFHKRVIQNPLMQAFDAPDAQVTCTQRMNTTVAPQGLALLNDPFVRLRAKEFAGRLKLEAGGDPASQVRKAFLLAVGREPTTEELGDSTAFLASQAEARAKRDATVPTEDARLLALTDFCQMMFALNEFIYID